MKYEDELKFIFITSECKLKVHDAKDQIKVLKMSSKEAEAVKLFSNTFLAMRVSFFNELDSFSEVNSINAEKVINGVCDDPRIGNFYNNPSFGYGGYCLPKDTQQLLENFKDTPNEIIKSVIKANATRKQFIVNSILKRNPGIQYKSNLWLSRPAGRPARPVFFQNWF